MSGHQAGGDPGLTHRTIAAGVWVLSGTTVQAVLRLMVLTVLARLLGPRDFGLVAAAMVVIAFCRILLKSGIRPALVQRPVLEERHERTGFWLSIAVGLAFASGVWNAADTLARQVFSMPELAPVLRAMAMVIPLQSLGVVAKALLERDLRFQTLVRTEISAYVLGYAGCGLTLAFAGFGVWALVGAYVAQELVYTALALYSRPHPKAFVWDPAAAGEISRFGTGYAAAAIGNVAALQGDNWVVGRWLGQESLGLYKYAYELTSMVAGLMGQVLQQVLFPAMAKVQGDPERLAVAYRRGVGMIALLVLPASAILYTLAPELIQIVLGDQWSAAVVPFQILSLVLLVRTTYRVSDALARATGAVYRRAWRHWIHAGAIVGLAWVGQHAGLEGLTAGVAFGMIINFLLMAHLSTHLARISWRDVIVSHLGAMPSFVLSWSAASLAAGASRHYELPPLAVVAITLAVLTPVVLASVRWLPTWFLGRDGLQAIGLLTDFVDRRFPSLLERSLVRHILPRPAAARRGR